MAQVGILVYCPVHSLNIGLKGLVRCMTLHRCTVRIASCRHTPNPLLACRLAGTLTQRMDMEPRTSISRIYDTSLIACPRRSLRQGLGRVAERVILYRSAHRRLIFLWSCRNLASPSSGRSMVSHGLCVYRLQE